MPSTTPTLDQIELLTFDWDGTLFDSTALIVHAIQNAASDVGGVVPDKKQAAWVIGMGLADAMAHLDTNMTPAQQRLMQARYLYHYSQLQHELSLFDGALEMLRDLKNQGFKLAVATGKSRRGLNEALAHTDLHDLFDSTRTADETAGKPDPLMLHEIMDELGVGPERMVMIGDTTHDLQLAKNALTHSVAVSYGAHAVQEFANFQPVATVDDISGLHRLLQGFKTRL